MFYSFRFSPSVWFSLSLPWPSTFINQLSAEVLSALACQIETLLWLARGRLPFPSANAGLDSYHVSSHYRQSRALGRQWEESSRGIGRRGPEERPSITLRAPLPLYLPLTPPFSLTNRVDMQSGGCHAQVEVKAKQTVKWRNEEGERWTTL